MSEDHQGEKGQLEDMGIVIFKGALKVISPFLYSRKGISVHINQGSGLKIHVGKMGSFY